MSSARAELALKSALLGTGLVQPVESMARTGHVEVLCRQVPGQEKAWLEVLKQLLVLEKDGISLLLARRYVLRNDALAFGWHVQVNAAGKLLGAAVEAMVEVLAKAKPTLSAATPQVVATPRPAVVQSAPDTPRPGGETYIRVVRREIDEETGQLIVEEEMPLPHVYRDLNRPAYPGAAGAKKTASTGISRPT